MQYRAILGDLIFRTSLHVGSGEGNDATDALCRRTSDGRWVIPGTAIAGSLRSLAIRLAPRLKFAHHRTTACRALQEISADLGTNRQQPCCCITCQLFGFRFLGTDETDRDNRPWISRLAIFDAVAADTDTHTRIRDGVGIDRTSGAAARHAASKFDLEVVPAGTVFTLRIEFPLYDSHATPAAGTNTAEVREGQEQLLAAVLAEWQKGRGVLGGRTARGTGAFELRNVRLVTRRLNSADGLMAYLATDEPSRNASDQVVSDRRWVATGLRSLRENVADIPASTCDATKSFFLLEFKLHSDGPLVINDPAAAALSGFEFAPWIEQLKKNSRPVLPGSSLRGVLRSQAERIARTIVSQQIMVAGGEQASWVAAFKEQCPACDPLQDDYREIDHEQSAAGEADTAESTLVPRPRPLLASCQAIAESREKDTSGPNVFEPPRDDFCLACQLFGSTYWGSRLRVEDARLVGEPPRMHAQDFLAIDRFTGGGLERAKFDAITAWRPRFQVRLMLENPRRWELGWLTLALRDLHDGLVPVGFGSAKGFGRVTFTDERVQLGYVSAADLDELLPAETLQVASWTPARSSGLYRIRETNWEGWLTGAESCVTAFHDELKSFHRRLDNRPSNEVADSYFGHRTTSGVLLSDLYPISQQETE